MVTRQQAFKQALTESPQVRTTSAFEIDPETQLSLPKGTVKGLRTQCKHENADRKRGGYGYRCKDCGAKDLLLVAVASVFMTPKEVQAWLVYQKKSKNAKEVAAKQPRRSRDASTS